MKSFQPKPYDRNELDNYLISRMKNLVNCGYLSTNTDYDGTLSTAFIQKAFPKTKVVSFNDGKNNVWVKKRYTKKPLASIDYNTNRQGFSADQHVDLVKIDETTILNENVLNINHFFGISNENYTDKYPFGLCLVIISTLERMGFNFDDVKLDTEVVSGITLIDVIMRADSTLNACVDERYRRKGVWWKNVLCEGLSDNSLTKRIFGEIGLMTIKKVNPVKDRTTAELWKKEMNKRSRESFGTTKGTGFNAISKRFFNMMKSIYNAVGTKFDIDTDSDNYNTEPLCRVRYFTKDETRLENFVNDQRIVGKAIIYKNRVSVQVKPADIKSFIRDYWEHIEVDKFEGEKSFEENGSRKFVRMSNEDGTGGYQIRHNRKEGYVNW